jgi:hypothetical protein
MKRLFIIIPIALIVCASTIKQSEPPTFKQDMEAFYSILENSLTQLETGGDTTSICETIKNAGLMVNPVVIIVLGHFYSATGVTRFFG